MKRLFILPLTVLAMIGTAQAGTFSVPHWFPGGGNLGDGAMHSFDINTALPGMVTDINVGVMITGECTEDLTLRLINGSNSATLFAGHDFCDGVIPSAFDDEASSPLTGPLSASFTASPDEPLSIFDGSPLAGTWTLEIQDNTGLLDEQNYLLSWQIYGTESEFPTIINAPPPSGVTPTPNGTEIPEPATLAMFAFGLAGLGFARRRRNA